MLDKHNVAFLTAPYEADAQLAYMAQAGVVEYVISEDSDLLVYGTPKVGYMLRVQHSTDFKFGC